MHDDGSIVDRFVDACFCEAGLWNGGQCSDGVGELRVYETTPDVARMAGRIWEVAKQTQHAFWLNLTKPGELIQWTLFAEMQGTEREKRHAFDLYERAEDIAWEHRFFGDAALEDGVLVLRSLKQGHEG